MNVTLLHAINGLAGRSAVLDAGGRFGAQELLYVEWVAEMGRSGVPAPNLLLACFFWCTGAGFALVMPRRWLCALVVATVAWMARAFFVRRDGPRVGTPDGAPRSSP